MTEVIMPKMGDGMEEGTLLEWLKKEGEAVKAGEIIGTIQTDKATLELEAPGSGVLSGFKIQGGETVPVGVAIAAILKDGEKLPDGWSSASNGQAKAAEAPKAVVAAAAVEAVAAPKSDDRVKASPLARKIAADKGVDLGSIVGSGPGGRVVEKDVLAAGSSKPAPVAQPVAASAEDVVVKLNKIRQITAQKTQQSKQHVPHFYVTVEVEIDKLQALRQMFEEEGSGKISVNDFVIKACALALREMPSVNSSFVDATTVLQHGAIHIGMAVALEDGLTLPVIHNVDTLGVREIGAKSRELAFKARDNKLHPDELTGSTFSISNMGMLDVENFAAIIVEPNAAIVAVGTAKKKLRINDEDEAEIRQVMKLTGSFDHRVVDGAVGARFMNLVRAALENPTRLLS